ncbi:MAG: non-homologous end-joining DNA ligase [Nocardioidaceae bacterium]
MRPMLATRGTSVPTGPAWMHEVKWDGMRVLVEVTAGVVTVRSRNENDVTGAFPELGGLAAALGRDAVLDGEVVAFAGGVPTFGALAERIHVRDPRRVAALAKATPVTLLVFDVLRLDGDDVTGLPLHERRALLESLGLADVHWQTPPAYDDGLMLLEATKQQGLEGVVSKKRDSRYHPGRRTPDWLKFPHRDTTSYVVGGWRPETESTGRLGAVLVGEPTPTGLRFRGRVGSGIAGKTGQRLLELLTPLGVDASPFADAVPAVDAKGTVWVRPEVVVDVASLGFTPGGRLRQPSFTGVRPDLTAESLAESSEEG